jgi:hypothetical protein
MEEIKLLLGMSGLPEFYDEDEIERIARLPIELSLPLLTHYLSANRVSRELERGEKEEKEKFQEENVR